MTLVQLGHELAAEPGHHGDDRPGRQRHEGRQREGAVVEDEAELPDVGAPDQPDQQVVAPRPASGGATQPVSDLPPPA